MYVSTDLKLAFSDTTSNSADRRSITGVLIVIHQIICPLSVQCNLLHYSSLVLELTGEKRGTVADQVQDKTITARNHKVPCA